MLKKFGRYVGHAYDIGTAELKSVTQVEEGTWVSIDTDGKLIVSDGTKKSFILIGSQRTGRDQTANGLFKGVSFIHGPFFGLNTDKFDNTKTYLPMMALKVTTGGILTPITGTGTEIIVAYVGKYINSTELEIMSATGKVVVVAPSAPAVTRDDTANTVSGMTVDMEYNLDNAGYVLYDAVTFAALDFSGAHTLLVRVAAKGIVPAGAVTTLTFTA